MNAQNDKIQGYKGFNSKLQCTPGGKVFQYEVGKVYEEQKAVACESGFHFCKNPFDVWKYYGVFDSRFCKIESEASEVVDKDDKSVTTRIEIKAELSLGDFINECIDYLISQLAASGNASQLAASGGYSQLAASGDFSQLAASGKNSVVAAIGKQSTAKAVKGCWIVLAEYDEHGVPVCVKSVKVDGKRIKENTVYKLENKRFVEVV